MLGVYPNACAVVSMLSASLTLAKTQEGTIIPHFVSTTKNEKQRDLPKVKMAGSSQNE